MLMKIDPMRHFEGLASAMLSDSYSTSGIDAYRDGDVYYVDIDLPGFDPEQIEVVVENDILSVSAVRNRTRRNGAEVLLSGRYHGKYQRSIRLAEHLDTQAVTARYDSGVLQVRIPVLASAKARKIQVEVTEHLNGSEVAQGSLNQQEVTV